MSVDLITGGDGSSTSAMTTALGSGFTASGGVFISTSYASASAVSVGGSVGGANAACGIAADLAGTITAGSNYVLYWGMDSASDFTGNGYKAVITITASHLRDYIEISKIVAGTPTVLTPVAPLANGFASVADKKIYFKRGKLAAGDTIYIRWVDNEHQVWMHDADEADGLYMGKVVDSTKTTAGYCGLGLGTDSNAQWDNVYTGTFTIKYCTSAGDDTTGDGSISTPYRQIRRALHNVGAGNVVMAKAATYNRIRHGEAYTSPSYTLSIPKGTNWYNPTVVQNYNSDAAVIQAGSTQNDAVRLSQGTDAYFVAIGIANDGQDVHEAPGWILHTKTSRVRLHGCDAYSHGTAALPRSGFQSTHFGDASSWLSDYDTRFTDCVARDHDFTHGMYLTRSGEVVEFCDLHDNFYHGLQYQPIPSSVVPVASGGAVRNNRIWGNNGASAAAGLYVASVYDLKVFGNWIYANADGIQLAGNSSSFTNGVQRCLIKNNTIIRNSEWGIIVGWDTGGSHTGDPAADNEIINNIIWNNTLGTISYRTYGAEIDQVESNNVTSTNPGFTDDTNADKSLWDLTLTADTSVAVDGGMNTSADVPVDHLGFPNIVAYDIGAAFWPESVTPPVDPVVLSPVSLNVTKNTNKLLSGFSVQDDNDPDVGTYTVEIVCMTGTLNDGV